MKNRYLRFFNELTVNGKAVEDDVDDDYTAEEDDTSEENEDTASLDLNPTDDENGEGTEDETEDSNDDVNDDYTAEDPDSQDDTTDTTDNPEGTDDTEDDDYTAEDPDSQGDDTTDNSEGIEDTEDEPESTDDTLEDKIKNTESQIFNSLSDDEKKIKSQELIDNYISAKLTVKLFIEKVRTITVTEENKLILNFVEMNLLELEKIISDYIINRYNKKSYIENFVTYQQIILTMTQLKDIISKLKIEEKP